MATSLNTESKSFRELIGNGRTYRVPAYQRDYSWDENEWEDLWYDIEEIENEGYHYIGYIVLQSEDDKNFVIIDGQQRLTTLSIIMLAGIRLLKEWSESNINKEENEERIKELERSFIGNRSASSLTISSKLYLNRNNDDFYQSFLIRNRKSAGISKEKLSVRRLNKALEFYYDNIKKKFSNNTSGEQLARFLEEQVSEKLLFTIINVKDDLNAYKVFETLNSRGVKLSTSDLLKNYLFSIVFKSSEIDLKQAERQWQKISDNLREDDFSTFLRHYWNSKYSLERKQTLFKALKRKVNTPAQVIELLDDLEESVVIYSAFSSSEDLLWDRNKNNNQAKYIAELKLFNVTQCYSVLLAAYKNLEKTDFTKFLKNISIISFRYNIISGLNPNEIELKYNDISIRLASKKISTNKEASEKLKSIYVEDEKFKQNFATKIISLSGRNKKLARYILFSLENQISETDYAYEDSKATIEHILPENATDDEWLNYFKAEEQEIFGEYLGNYTLLEENKNNMLANKSFQEKQKIYKTSVYKITRENLDYTEWTPSTLRKRQDIMANWASSIWKINF